MIRYFSKFSRTCYCKKLFSAG